MAKKALFCLFYSLLLLFVSSHEPHHTHKCAHDELKIVSEYLGGAPAPKILTEERSLITWESIRIILDFSRKSNPFYSYFNLLRKQ